MSPHSEARFLTLPTTPADVETAPDIAAQAARIERLTRRLPDAATMEQFPADDVRRYFFNNIQATRAELNTATADSDLLIDSLTFFVEQFYAAVEVVFELDEIEKRLVELPNDDALRVRLQHRVDTVRQHCSTTTPDQNQTDQLEQAMLQVRAIRGDLTVRRAEDIARELKHQEVLTSGERITLQTLVIPVEATPRLVEAVTLASTIKTMLASLPSASLMEQLPRDDRRRELYNLFGHYGAVFSKNHTPTTMANLERLWPRIQRNYETLCLMIRVFFDLDVLKLALRELPEHDSSRADLLDAAYELDRDVRGCLRMPNEYTRLEGIANRLSVLRGQLVTHNAETVLQSWNQHQPATTLPVANVVPLE
ncbi:MAG: hypothetical protein HYV33_05085 [Candidatus Kerfeldbacteria bacterium]|nr:hypothetical protein [Candidatus Kerfeldbacteria bacterium]